MLKTTKRGSSRRKGDEYQDLTALRFALEKYIARTPFKMYLEYEKSGNLDDIVIFQGTEIEAYQVKYSINPLGVYDDNDFINPESSVNFKKFSDSWKALKKRFPDHNLTAYLCSNRALNTTLVDLITPDGAFTPKVIEDRRRGEAKQIRSALESATGLDPEPFSQLLLDFKFHVRQPTLKELEQHIRTILLDKALGLSDGTIFLDLKESIKQNAIFSHEAITIESVDSLLERLQSKLLIPQVFPINQDHFVEQKSLSAQLDKMLPGVDGGYLIVTGLPGSGKSTSLTTYFKSLDKSSCEVFSYYCFVGVNDNAQKLRTQAESLRANLLNEFHHRYPSVLNRRFDYSERNFLECLKTLAKNFVERGRHFVIYLDGLDHVERLEAGVRDTVISALPSDVPKGITIVVATQELHKWPHFLKRIRESSETHIQMPLFSFSETQDYLENKRGISGLSNADISTLHNKCEGLPLYLQYAAEVVLSRETISEALDSLSPATGGDIRNYYELIWAEFEQIDRAEAKHLCAVMSCLRFPVHRDYLYPMQKSLKRPQFESAYKCMSHLLRNFENKLTIFHNSFREFIFSQLHTGWIQEIKSDIADFLKSEKNSPLWFGYVFEYCHETADDTYIVDEVSADFVDRALLHFRPSKEILNAINWAIQSAYRSKNIVQLSRLASLKYRTNERLEYNFDRTLLADALLALGREQDVITFSFSSDADRWIVDSHTSLAVISALANAGKIDLGRKLFDVFTKEFRGIKSDNRNSDRPQILAISRCLGIYTKNQARTLRWLSQYRFQPDTMEQNDIYASSYAPHLETYIDTLVQFGRTAEWERLKRVKRLFPNSLVKYLLIRSLANYNLLNELRAVVTDYIEQGASRNNLELAFYAAKVGLPIDKVSEIAGLIQAPVNIPPDYLSGSDPTLKTYAYSFIILGYELNESTYTRLLKDTSTAKTLWASALQHLLKSCYCIGRSYQSDTYDWFSEACESIDYLIEAKQGDGERVFESIDLIRDILPFTIGQLTKEIQTRFPDRLHSWAEKIAQLRDSYLWTTHFGISESIQNYGFELVFWEEIAKNSLMRTKIAFILKDCAVTYEQSTLLKGESRYTHFMRLSALMAKCGMRNDAEKWLRYGIRSSLIYGYHKDTTLQILIDVLKLLNHHQPEKALERCSRILSMIRWMPHLTDGRGTKWFTQSVFSAVLAANRQAAFDLLVQFSQSISRWKMQDCLEEYLLETTEGDHEYLWCLSEIFSNHFSEDGRHCKQLTKTRQHIVNLKQESCLDDNKKAFVDRFRDFVLTEITPRHWPKKFKKGRSLSDKDDDIDSTSDTTNDHSQTTFLLDGDNITRENLVQKCKCSFSESLQILERLKEQNKHFYEPGLIDSILKYHIVNAKNLDDLLLIKDYVESKSRWQDQDTIESLAERFQEFDDYGNAMACFAIAFSCHNSFYHWRKNAKYLATIAEYDRNVAEETLLKECYDSLSESGNGYDTPAITSTGLDILGNIEQLEAVFNDFLTHCESMFAQLPVSDEYSWLKDYTASSSDENQLIFQFSLDELAALEIDHGDRLVCALTKLIFARPEKTVPMLVDTLLSATGRVFHRTLIILFTLASHSPKLLIQYQQDIAQLLDREDFFCRKSVLYILKNINTVKPLQPHVANEVERIKRKYSINIFSSTYRLPTNPSPIFLDFLKQNTLFYFLEQIKLIERIIQVQEGSIVATIEEYLKIQNWDMDEEHSRIKDDWDGNVHPQGWPVIWITTEFQELATEALSHILNEVVEKLKLSDEHIQWLWKAVQMVDPEYVIQGVIPRPDDIEPLHVVDKNEWFKELNDIEPLQFFNKGEDWITVFEKKKMSHDEKFNVPYRQELSLKATLVPLQVYGGVHTLEELSLPVERIVPLPGNIPATLEQVRDALKKRKNDALNMAEDCIPLIATHKNPETFLGYLHVCSLASYLIKNYSLTFDGLNLIRQGEVVAKYEIWQEGYQDDAYSREKLSEGIRLKISRTFLAEICRQYEKILCIQITEKREIYKSLHGKEPKDRKGSNRYVLYHSLYDI